MTDPHPDAVPDEVNALLDRLVPAIREALGERVTGIYLWGSATLGGYRPGHSDVDLLVLLTRDPDAADLAALTTVHAAIVDETPAWTDRVEVAYVGSGSLRTFRATPHTIARISPGEPLNLRTADRAWLIDWYQAREHGVTLFGPPARQVLPPIGREELREMGAARVRALAGDIRAGQGVGMLAYLVVGMSRGLHLRERGTQVSKQSAAEWVGATYPEWEPLTSAAATQLDADAASDEHLTAANVECFGAWAVARAAPSPTRWRRRAVVVLALLGACVVAPLVLLPVLGLVKAYRVPAGSMEPTLRCGDRMLIERLTGRGDEPRRFDVVTFHPPAEPGSDGQVIISRPRGGGTVEVEEADTTYVKRVIGLPGERIEIRDHRAYVDGARLREPFVMFEGDPGGVGDVGPLTVPDDTYYVLGDHRDNAADSRVFGFVPREFLDGRVVGIYWPPSHAGPLPDDPDRSFADDGPDPQCRSGR